MFQVNVARPNPFCTKNHVGKATRSPLSVIARGELESKCAGHIPRTSFWERLGRTREFNFPTKVLQASGEDLADGLGGLLILAIVGNALKESVETLVTVTGGTRRVYLWSRRRDTDKFRRA